MKPGTHIHIQYGACHFSFLFSFFGENTNFALSASTLEAIIKATTDNKRTFILNFIFLLFKQTKKKTDGIFSIFSRPIRKINKHSGTNCPTTFRTRFFLKYILFYSQLRMWFYVLFLLSLFVLFDFLGFYFHVKKLKKTSFSLYSIGIKQQLNCKLQ